MSASPSVRALKLPPELGMLLLAAALSDAPPCGDPNCEACASHRDEAAAQEGKADVMGQTAQQETSLKEAIRQDLDITTKARQTEDANVLQFLSSRIRTTSQQLLDADLASPRDDEAVASHTARLQHLRYLRGLFEARSAVSA